MRRSDIIAGLVLAALGFVTIFAIVPHQISGTSLYGIAPDVYPLTMLWLFSGFSVLLVVTRLAGGASEGEGEDEAPLTLGNVAYLGGAVLVFVAGYLAIEHLGFVAGGAAIAAVTMIAMGARHYPMRLVLVAALAPSAIYLIFRHLFVVLLP